jgi:hypothetical protein
MGRRGFCSGAMAAIAAALLAPFRALGAVVAPGAPPRAEPLAALPAWLDTLIPADGSPSATQLDVDAALLADAGQQPVLMRTLAAGCRRLDNEARRLGAAGFAALSEPLREQVAAAAAAAPEGSLPRQFFLTTQYYAFAHYYARPESWPGLGYHGPPQPVGFPDHADRPR